MDWPLHLQGRTLDVGDIQLILDLRKAHPDWSRRKLSIKVCHAWGWVRADGQVKDMACRELLRKLHDRGLIELPPPQHGGNRIPKAQPVVLDTTPVNGPLATLQPIAICDARACPDDHRRFDQLLAEHHYLSFKKTVGQNMKYVAKSKHGQIIGCVLFGAAAWSCASRDQFIGWDRPTRERNLQHIANNTRFLIPGFVTVPNLASFVLSRVLRRVSGDWFERYGHELVQSVLVTNGVYEAGGRVSGIAGELLTNRVVIDKAVTVQSVNGAEATIIKGTGPSGDAAVRCVWMTDGATLVGFTLTNGATRSSGVADRDGGGLHAQSDAVTINNCILIGNRAHSEGGGSYKGKLNNCTISGNSAPIGGGANYSMMNNCTLSDNVAGDGGGARGGTLNNCTVSGNNATRGGGARASTLNNCIVYGNTAATSNNYYDGTFTYSCSPGLTGLGNITNDPQFVDAAGGDYRLLPTSPCVDAGSNVYVTVGTDLDGNPRIFGASVDMGAYEYQGALSADSDNDGIPDWWETARGLNPAVSNAPNANKDGDWMTDWEEYLADTDPDSTNSFFSILLVTNPPAGTMSLMVDPTSTTRVYKVEWATNLMGSPVMWYLYPPEKTGTGFGVSFTVTNNGPSRVYRTGVRLP